MKARQRGAALLLAMLTVVLVATLASAALWTQWRAFEIERAERQRAQAAWILNGALDWARLILREDARGNQNSGSADHLGEPWALPLEEARLSSFLAADRNNNAEGMLEAFLSGEMIDLQSRLNVGNLVRTSGSGANAQVEVSEPDLLAFQRLFEQLGLPRTELDAAVQELLDSTRLALTDPQPSRTALLPTKLSHLAWLGIGRASLAALECGVDTVLVARSDGTVAADVRPLVRFNVQVIVEQGGRRESGYAGGGNPEPDGGGVILYANRWKAKPVQNSFDLNLAGSYDLFGREHDAVFGYSQQNTDYTTPIYTWHRPFPEIGNIYTWDGSNPGRPPLPSRS